MGRWTEIARLVRAITKRHLADVHTHLPAQVVSYNAATNTCSVQPCVKRMRTEDSNNLQTVTLPQIDDVPVMLFGSGKCIMTVAPQAGSYGLLHTTERAIENWMLQGGTVEPTSSRMHDISDSFFQPGAYPLIADGDNGLIAPPIEIDRIELRTRLGTTYVSVTDDNQVAIEANNIGNIFIDNDGKIEIYNASGSWEMKPSGQVDVNNGNFTVDP